MVGHAYLVLREMHRLIKISGCSCHVRVIEIGELSVSQSHCLIEIPSFYFFGNSLGCLNCLHERLSGDLVLIYGDKWSWGLRSSLQNCVDSFDSLKGSKHAIIGTS